MYDATIATWESKYVYNRRRPSEARRGLPTALPVPNSPSYPSEHAATAQAAASVLAYFLPAEAASFQSMAEEAGWSRVLAGLQYPSDYTAGLDLGRKVAEQVIAKAKSDGSDAVWTGTRADGAVQVDRDEPGQRHGHRAGEPSSSRPRASSGRRRRRRATRPRCSRRSRRSRTTRARS